MHPDLWLFVAIAPPTATRHSEIVSIKWHVMQHTAVTRLVLAKTDTLPIMKINGHETVATVLRDTHVDAKHIDSAAATLGMDFIG